MTIEVVPPVTKDRRNEAVVSSALKIIFLAALILVCCSIQTEAQQERRDDAIKEFESRLKTLSQDLAEEYVDILENLQDALEDYQDYMEDLAEEDLEHDVAAVRTLQRGLRQKAYDNPEKLLDDIYDAVDEIKEVEKKHRVIHNTNNPPCCRLSRSLRKELLITAELVEDYTEQLSDRTLKSGDILEYIEIALESVGELGFITDIEEKELEEALKELDKIFTDANLLLDEGKRLWYGNYKYWKEK